MKQPCVYILASKRNGTLCVGGHPTRLDASQSIEAMRPTALRNAIASTAWSHAEFRETMLDAIQREKQLKRWRRAWKLELIERANPEWRDLSGEIIQS